MARENNAYKPGDLVFVKVRGYSHWPAKIQKPVGSSANVRYAILFFGTHQTFEARTDAIVPFNEDSKKLYGAKCKTESFAQAMAEIENYRSSRRLKSAEQPAPSVAEKPKADTKPPVPSKKPRVDLDPVEEKLQKKEAWLRLTPEQRKEKVLRLKDSKTNSERIQKIQEVKVQKALKKSAAEIESPKDEYKPGDLVFVKVRGYSHWPAKIQSPIGSSTNVRYAVLFFGTHQTFNARTDAIVPFNAESKKLYGAKCKTESFAQAMREIENDPELKFADEAQVGTRVKMAPSAQTTSSSSEFETSGDQQTEAEIESAVRLNTAKSLTTCEKIPSDFVKAPVKVHHIHSKLSRPSHRSLNNTWKTWFRKNFPQEASKRDPTLLKDYGKDPQFEEPIIDNLRDQKTREVENLREQKIRRLENLRQLLIKRCSQQSIKMQ